MTLMFAVAAKHKQNIVFTVTAKHKTNTFRYAKKDRTRDRQGEGENKNVETRDSEIQDQRDAWLQTQHLFVLICVMESAISGLPTTADVADDGNSAMYRLLLIL